MSRTLRHFRAKYLRAFGELSELQCRNPIAFLLRGLGLALVVIVGAAGSELPAGAVLVMAET
jgi:hypothetical protein